MGRMKAQETGTWNSDVIQEQLPHLHSASFRTRKPLFLFHHCLTLLFLQLSTLLFDVPHVPRTHWVRKNACA